MENALWPIIEAEVVFNAAAYNQVDVAEKEPQAAFSGERAGGTEPGARLPPGGRPTGSFFHRLCLRRSGAASVRRKRTRRIPLGAYAVSKLAGELYAQAYLDRALVVRTSGVFGPGGLSTARGNFVELMLRLAASTNPIRVVEDHVASPTLRARFWPRAPSTWWSGARTGVFHIGGGTPISWFEFARMIFEVAGVQPKLMATNEREYRTPARRPRYSALSNAKMERVGLDPMPPLKEAVSMYFERRKQDLAQSRV